MNAVLVAEGHQLWSVDKTTRRKLVDLVTDWVYDGGHGRGTSSGLPRFLEAPVDRPA